MANQVSIQAEQMKQRPDVKKALDRTGREPAVTTGKVETKDKLWLGTSVVLLAALAVLYFVVQHHVFDFFGVYLGIFRRAIAGAMAVVVLLVAAKALDVYFIARISSAVSRFNLRRILRLIAGLLVVLLVISVLFQNWYTAVVSIGLISLMLGLALQTPVTSFIGWIYIMVMAPYQVGDRIKIEDATGDVIDVSYLDTTLWEFGGDLLSTDHPTGRIIKFPNSRVLSNAVYNYTWPIFPYIWNEIKFSIGYESDLEFVAETMQRIAQDEVGERMMEQVKVYRSILSQTPVDELEVREHPAVLFRVNSNTWLDAIVRYLVHPKEAGRVKSRMIKRLLVELNKSPDRVLFPKGNAR
jgi:small-conductance mechanosensitive channel